jgi:hypothetical protein
MLDGILVLSQSFQIAKGHWQSSVYLFGDDRAKDKRQQTRECDAMNHIGCFALGVQFMLEHHAERLTCARRWAHSTLILPVGNFPSDAA